MRTDCEVIHGASGTCPSYGTRLPPLMIQRHEQQLGASDGDSDEGDVGIDGELYYNIHHHHHHPSKMQ